eukprot:12887345-Prorocentrum_lima.AAC.1
MTIYQIPRITREPNHRCIREYVLELAMESQDTIKASQQQGTNSRTSVKGIKSVPVTSKDA